MFWRMDLTPGFGQHLPGASPQHLDAAHGPNCWVLCKEVLPTGKAWLLLKAISDCLQIVFWLFGPKGIPVTFLCLSLMAE